MAKRTITITIPDDMSNEDYTQLFYALCAQTEENDDGEPWCDSPITIETNDEE